MRQEVSPGSQATLNSPSVLLCCAGTLKEERMCMHRSGFFSGADGACKGQPFLVAVYNCQGPQPHNIFKYCLKLFTVVYCSSLESFSVSSDLLYSIVILGLWPKTDYSQEDNKHKHWPHCDLTVKGNEKQKHPVESTWVQGNTVIKNQGFVAV